jgi:hypothetical protein
MKTLPNLISLLLLAAVTTLWAGCQTRVSLFDIPKEESLKASAPKPKAVAASLGAADVKTETVTLAAVDTIAIATAQVRTLTKSASNSVEIGAVLAKIDAAVLSVRSEIAAHPAAVVAKTINAQADKIESDAAPNGWYVALGYTLGFGSLALLAVVVFASNWLKTVPVVGRFIADTVGKQASTLLFFFGSGCIAATKAYIWIAHHPRIFDALVALGFVTAAFIYVNAHNEGWIASALKWIKIRFASKLPWVKAKAARIESEALALEQRVSAAVKAELAKLHAAKPAAPTPPPAPATPIA